MEKTEAKTFTNMPGDQMTQYDRPSDMPGNDNLSTQSISMESESMVKPSDITLKYDQGKLLINWNTAPNGYQVILYKGNQEITSQYSNNPPATLDTFSLSAGKYCAKVNLRGEDIDRSNECEGEPCIVKLATPSNILLIPDGQNQKFKVSWDPVTEATEYRVEVIQALSPQAAVIKDETSWEIDIASLDGQAIGYQACVQAIGDEQHIDSDIGKSHTVAGLPAPGNVMQSYQILGSSKQLTGNWDAVKKATGYLVRVVNLDDLNKVVAQQQIENNTQTRYTFDTNQFTSSGVGKYQVWVKAIGNEQYLDSPYGKASDSIERLAIPMNVSQRSELQHKKQEEGDDLLYRTTLTAEWEAVTNAKGYYAQLVNVSDENIGVVDSQSIEIMQGLNVSFQTGELADQQESQYQIWVKAVGDGSTTLDSNFGKAEPMVTRLAAPKNVVMEKSQIDPPQINVQCDPVDKAERYFFQVVKFDGPNAELVDRRQVSPENKITLDISEIEPFENGEYQIWVRAATNENPEFLDSAFGKPLPTDKISFEIPVEPTPTL